MEDIYVDIRKIELGERLNKDMITVEALIEELDNALYKIDLLEEDIKTLKESDEERYEDYLSNEADNYNDDKKLGLL